MMYCYKCGLKIDERALECEHCGANTAHVMIPRFYRASVFLGLCTLSPYIAVVASFFVPLADTVLLYFLIVFGIAGLFTALKSKRRFAVVLNIIGIILWVLMVVTPFFETDSLHNEKYRDRGAVSEALGEFVK
jgi:hypothetical protein